MDLNIISITRNNKKIILYVKDELFNGLSEMVIDSISDVEIYDQPERLNPETQYPDGTMWQDDSSLDEEGLVETYVRRNGEWIFGFKAKPINIFSPVRCESLDS